MLLLTYKAIHGSNPTYLLELLIFYKPSGALRSANDALLVIPRTRLNTYEARAFTSQASLLWNLLPGCIFILLNLSLKLISLICLSLASSFELFCPAAYFCKALWGACT